MPEPMIINLLRLPGSYWLYRKRMISHQAGDSHVAENRIPSVSKENSENR